MSLASTPGHSRTRSHLSRKLSEISETVDVVRMEEEETKKNTFEKQIVPLNQDSKHDEKEVKEIVVHVPHWAASDEISTYIRV